MLFGDHLEIGKDPYSLDGGLLFERLLQDLFCGFLLWDFPGGCTGVFFLHIDVRNASSKVIEAMVVVTLIVNRVQGRGGGCDI